MMHKASRIRGAAVHAIDGSVGHVEDFLFDDRLWRVRFLVVNTGAWLVRHPVLISPEAVMRGWDMASLQLTLSREQIRHSPEIASSRTMSRDDEQRVLTHFGHQFYWDGFDGGGKDAHLVSAKDVMGDHVEALDGSIGHVEDFLIEEATWEVSYFVVDTRNWIGGKSVLVAPNALRAIDWDHSSIQVSCTRDAVEHSPALDTAPIGPGEDAPVIWIM
jgi:hypothetical protein